MYAIDAMLVTSTLQNGLASVHAAQNHSGSQHMPARQHTGVMPQVVSG
jgi:hypothetical protein